MTTCSSILAWKTPWREEPGRLQSMGSQRVGLNWAHTHKANSQFHSRAAPPQLVLEDAGGCGLDPFHLSWKLHPTWFLMTVTESRESMMRQPELLWTPETVAEILASSNFLDSSCRAIIGLLQTTPPIFNDYLGFPGVSQSRIIKVLLWEIKFAIQNPNIFSCPLKCSKEQKQLKIDYYRLSSCMSGYGTLILTWFTVTFIRSSPCLWKCFTGFMTETRVGPWLLENFTLSYLHILSYFSSKLTPARNVNIICP